MNAAETLAEIDANFKARIAALWPLRHQGRASELRTLIQAYRAWLS